MPKSEHAAAEGTFFRQQLGQLDWSRLKTPPALLAAGVLENRDRQTGDETAMDADGDRSEGGGSSVGGEVDPSRAGVYGRGNAKGGRGNDGAYGGAGYWGWKEGMVVGVAGGVLASAFVIGVAGVVRRSARGDRGYEDIS